MALIQERLHTIGEVSRKSGVSVKTIRHYSDIGILPPSRIADTGYRLYSQTDLSRLESIRTLRAAGFDLPRIGALLDEDDDATDALRLQLETVNLQIRNLERRRQLLESTLQHGEAAQHSYAERAQALGLLEAGERQAFLAEHLEKGLEGVPVDPDVKAWFWRAIVSDMPTEFDEDQLEAWVELAQLVSDASFVDALREQVQPFWEEVRGTFDSSAWSDALTTSVDQAKRAIRTGQAPTGEREQRVVADWVDASAKAIGKSDDPEFSKWMLFHAERTYDARMERYWELLARIKQWEYDSELVQAHQWLLEGLRFRVHGR